LQWQQFSVYIIGLGFGLNALGAIFNSLHMKCAFLIWMISNTITIIYFAGAWKGKWEVQTTAESLLCFMYLFFLVTSTWGYFN
jgi:hypothetical protein